jgi:hypothetical protein
MVPSTRAPKVFQDVKMGFVNTDEIAVQLLKDQ